MLPGTVWQKVLPLLGLSGTTPSKQPAWDLKQLFGPHLSAGAAIYLPSDSNYTDHVTQRWTTHAPPSYAGTVVPATVSDVANVVKIAAANDIPFLATGGGHGVSIQMEDLQDGLQVDLQRFKSVHFDPQTRLLTVGGGVRFSDLIEPLLASGNQFPLGTAYCVGVIGATLGGGVSANQGYTGLLIDLLESVQLVTAKGDVITASRTENADLFWGLTGAGANFGIVTSAVFRVPQTVNGGHVTNANYLFTRNQSEAFFGYLASLDDDLPPQMALNIATAYNATDDQLILLVNVNFAGTPSSAAPHLARLEALGPLRSEVLDVAWPDVFATSYFGIEDTKACGRNQHVNMRSVGVTRTDPEALAAFLGELQRFNRERPEVITAMVLHRFSTAAVLEVPDEETAYPHRNIKMHIQLESEYEDRSHDEAVDAFLRSARRNMTAVSGFGSPRVYVNFAHGDEGPDVWYGARKLRRLVRLKRQWDPQGRFSFYNAIPLTPLPVMMDFLDEEDL
ncbi:uncharacterized protein THITE_2090100 [Thermothielavioides terrestris NRRL 8126]|uniref:FAD-binding PCMH-type domain-containing protein n=1 Tax=Thermothielavioides terrestris (strain ATCC 38088 / NRRL 8126) TaxID=578455 RepID=G2R8U1_THETT|nr:uncharacterized protein THITE_2090100 [Thermothielavioides terrestris NRRL 8126]AEO68590.1 hypothetical protein THITE_2090100 [Thermothielavioides terrestris NRRL 8126]